MCLMICEKLKQQNTIETHLHDRQPTNLQHQNSFQHIFCNVGHNNLSLCPLVEA